MKLANLRRSPSRPLGGAALTIASSVFRAATPTIIFLCFMLMLDINIANVLTSHYVNFSFCSQGSFDYI